MLDLHTLKPLQAMAASLFFKHRRLLLCLPRQEGKTELGVRLLHDITRRPFSSSSLFLSKDQPSGKKATREKFQRIFDDKLFEVNTSSVYLKSHPSSIIYMASVDKDPTRNRGGTYSAIHWTEVAFSKIEKGETITSVFDKVIAPMTRKTNGYAFLESTTNGKNGWKDLWDDHKTYGFQRLMVKFSDMVYMGLITPEEYEQVQSTTHPDVFSQEYECEWLSFQGKVYPELDHAIHVRPLAPPKPWQRVLISIDWGYHPSATAVLFAYVENDILYVFDEHYAMQELAAHTAEAIDSKLAQYGISKANTAAIADHEEDRIEELRRRNIVCGKAKKTNVMGARIEIKERLYFRKIVFDPKCKFALKDLDIAVWHPKKEGELDESQCTYGHFDMEATLRYLVRELGSFEEEPPLLNRSLDSISASEWDMKHARDQEQD